MRTLIFHHGVAVCQVEFPEDIERSRKGSLHVRPGATVEITDDELAHLCEVRPDLVDNARLVGGASKPSPKTEAKKAAPVSSGSETPKDESKAKDKPEPEMPAFSSKKSKAKSKGK